MKLGRYRVLNELGSGAMGVVWEAVRDGDELPAAIKFLPGTTAEEALRKEVRATARLDHPHVVSVLEQGEVGAEDDVPYPVGTPWYAMERADSDLADRPPFDTEELLDVLGQILDGLAHAHAYGLVHRDLKPANVLWVGETVKIADFGVALQSTLRTGSRAGTPAYMAPESIQKNRAIGPWTDLYAVGCLAWALMAGESPFLRPSISATLTAHLYQDLPPPPAHAPHGFLPWVRRLVAKDPLERYRLAADARAGLAAVQSSGTPLLGANEATGTLVPAGTNVTYADHSTELLFDRRSEVTEEICRAAPLGELAMAPWVRSWRPPGGLVLPLPRHGASLATIGLRVPPIVGRDDALDVLWSALGAVKAEGLAAFWNLSGPEGSDRWLAAEFLRRRAHELGVAHGMSIEGSLSDAIRETFGGLPSADVLSADELLREAIDTADRPVVITVAATIDPVLVASIWRWVRDLPVLLIAVGEHADATDLAFSPLSDAEIRRGLEHFLPMATHVAFEVTALSAGLPGVSRALVMAAVNAGVLAHGGDGRFRRVSTEPMPLLPFHRSFERQLDIAWDALTTEERSLVARLAHLDRARTPKVSPECSIILDAPILRELVRGREWVAGRECKNCEALLPRFEDDPAVLFGAGRLLACAERVFRHQDDSLTRYLGSLALAGLDEDLDQLRFFEAYQYCDSLFRKGEHRAGRWWSKRVVQLSQHTGNPEHRRHAHRMELQFAIVTGEDPRVAAQALQAFSQRPGDLFLVAKAFRGSGWTREALATLRRIESGTEGLQVAVMGMTATVLGRLGHLAEAEALANESVALNQRLSPEAGFRYIDRAGIRMKMGRHDEAIGDLDHAERLFRAEDNHYMLRNVLYLRSEIDCLRGDLAQARLRHDRVVEITVTLGGSSTLIAGLTLALLCRQGAWHRVERMTTNLRRSQADWTLDPIRDIAWCLAGEEGSAADQEQRLQIARESAHHGGAERSYITALLGRWPVGL